MARDARDTDAHAAPTATDFLVALAHDVRGPLATLAHQVELLTTEGLPDDLRRRSAAVVEASLGELAWLLETLDDVERLVLGEIDVHCSATDSTRLLHEIDRPGTTTVVPPVAVELVVDAALVRRVVRLLINAIASRGGERRVELRPAEGGFDIEVGAATSGTDPLVADQEADVHLRLAAALAELHGGRVQVGRRGGVPVAVLHLPAVGG